jgi:hypothetical protein
MLTSNFSAGLLELVINSRLVCFTAFFNDFVIKHTIVLKKFNLPVVYTNLTIVQRYNYATIVLTQFCHNYNRKMCTPMAKHV